MITVITAPQIDFEKESKYPYVFLAGGITGCPGWQSDFIDEMKKSNVNCTLLNPRRDDFDVSDPTASVKQIEWEYNMLQKQADIVIFWFPEETLCPISLFELGKELGIRHSNGSKKILIGCHKNYAKKFDIETQVDLVTKNTYGLEIEVVDELNKLTQQLINSLEWTK